MIILFDDSPETVERLRGRLAEPDHARVIPLPNGLETIVDAEDFERFGHLTMYANRVKQKRENWHVYVQFPGRRRVSLHRLIMDAKPGQYIDHADGNGLNNRRSNLRFCTRAQNMANMIVPTGKSGFRGVVWDNHNKKWRAILHFNGRARVVGYFRDPVAAAHARDEAAFKMFGEFARLNFPERFSHA